MPCSMLCVPAMTDHLDEIDALNASLKADDRELARLQKPHSRQARDIRSAVWGAIVIAWIAMIAMLAMLRIPLAAWLVIAILVSVIAPRSLLGIAALCLPKAPDPKKSASQR